MTNTLDISMVTYIKMLESDEEFDKYGLTWLSYGILPYMRSEHSNAAYEKFKQHYKIKYMQNRVWQNSVHLTSSKTIIRLHFTSEEDLFWFKLKYL